MTLDGKSEEHNHTAADVGGIVEEGAGYMIIPLIAAS